MQVPVGRMFGSEAMQVQDEVRMPKQVCEFLSHGAFQPFSLNGDFHADVYYRWQHDTTVSFLVADEALSLCQTVTGRFTHFQVRNHFLPPT